MDGSIADATMLRMHSGLSRAYQPAANATANDFFEELLRLPVASSIEVEDQPQETADPTQLTTAKDPTASNTAKDTEAQASSDSDDAEQDTQQPETLGCFVPWQPTTPVVEPEAEATSSEDIETPAVTAASSSPVTERPATKAGDVVEQSPVETIVAEQAAIAPTAAAVEEVEPVQPQLPQDQAQQVSVAKEVRRIKPRDEKSAQPAEPSQHQLQSDHRQPVKQSETDDKQVEAVQTSDGIEQSASEIVSEKLNPSSDSRDEGRQLDQREKWYERKDGDSSSQVNELLSAQSSDDSATDQSEAHDQLANNLASQPDVQVQADQAFLVDAMDSSNGPTELAQASIAAAALSSSSTPTTAEPGSKAASATAITATRGAGQVDHGSATHGPLVNHSQGVRSTSGSVTTASSGQEATPEEIESRQLDQQARVRLVQRVARSFSRLGPDGGQVSLKLHPPQLGVLNVSIKMEGQTMTARLQTESSAARDVILENLPVLRERLSEQGIEVEKFQVEVATSEEFSAGQQSQTNDSASGSSGRDRNPSPESITDYRRNSRTIPTSAFTERTVADSIRTAGWPDRSLDIKA